VNLKIVYIKDEINERVICKSDKTAVFLNMILMTTFIHITGKATIILKLND
jgi:hypothetical protein